MTKDTEEKIREVLLDTGPLRHGKILGELAIRWGRASGDEVTKTLRQGEFYVDDSDRWHLGNE